jgi:hypothetical protein
MVNRSPLRIGISHDIPGAVAIGCACISPQCPQILHGVSGVKERMPAPIAERGKSNDVARSVDRIGSARVASQCAEIDDIVDNLCLNAPHDGKDQGCGEETDLVFDFHNFCLFGCGRCRFRKLNPCT